MSEKLFIRVFKDYASENDLTKIYLNRIIPLLPYFEKPNDAWMEDSIRTVAFLPKKVMSMKSMNYSSSVGQS